MVQMLQTGFTKLAAIDKFYQCYMDVESLLAAYFLKFGRTKRTKGILIYAFNFKFYLYLLYLYTIYVSTVLLVATCTSSLWPP